MDVAIEPFVPQQGAFDCGSARLSNMENMNDPTPLPAYLVQLPPVGPEPQLVRQGDPVAFKDARALEEPPGPRCLPQSRRH